MHRPDHLVRGNTASLRCIRATRTETRDDLQHGSLSPLFLRDFDLAVRLDEGSSLLHLLHSHLPVRLLRHVMVTDQLGLASSLELQRRWPTAQRHLDQQRTRRVDVEDAPRYYELRRVESVWTSRSHRSVFFLSIIHWRLCYV